MPKPPITLRGYFMEPMSYRQVEIGKLIASIVAEPLPERNPEHVGVAHAIKIRLVDQDLLPRYTEL